MIPYKKILCPIDFSESSYEGLKAANELALHFSAELFVLHVISTTPIIYAVPTGPVMCNVPLYQQEQEWSSEKLINDVIRRYVSQELDAHPMVELGDAAHQIARIAQDNKLDLIIMSTHEKTGWRRLVNGSTVEKVVRLSPCPVLAVQVPMEGHESYSED